MPHAAPLTAFEQRWLAECLRLHEAEHGAFDDTELLPTLQNMLCDSETRILQRAELVVRKQRLSWIEDMRAWQKQARMIIGLLAVLALLSGFFSATGLMSSGTHGSEGRVVNVVWMVGALLFLPLASLLLWLILIALPRAHGGTALGQGGLWLQRHLPGQSAARLHVGHALLGLLSHHRLLRWGMGSLTHLLWLLALAAVVVGLLLMLATQRHVFIWETTILPSAVFVDFVRLSGHLPALIGFASPSPEIVLQSGLSKVTQSEQARQIWASWLLGGLIFYGLLPRLIAFGFSISLWMHGQKSLRLDLNQQGYALLRARLQPASQTLGISDPAPASIQTSRFHPWPLQSDHHATGHALVGLELDDDLVWPPAMATQFTVFPRIDSREDRQRLLAALHAAPPSSLVIAIDARRSPDRGSLNLINQVAQLCATPLLWLMQTHGVPAERINAWQQLLLDAGWPKDAFLDDAAASLWLRAPPA